MNKQDILNRINNSTDIVKEVFKAIISSESVAVRNTATISSQDLLKIIVSENALNTNLMKYLEQTSLETIMIYADEVSSRLKKTWKYKLFVAPFCWFWTDLLAFMYGLSAKKLNHIRTTDYDGWLEVGDAIFLAGLYIWLNEKIA